MNRDDVIRWAREAGLLPDNSHPAPQTRSMADKQARLERFAALVAAAEREACAKECDELAGMFFCYGDKSGAEIAVSLRDTIRARGQA